MLEYKGNCSHINKNEIGNFKVGDYVVYLGGDKSLVDLLVIGREYEISNIRDFFEYTLLQVNFDYLNTNYRIHTHIEFFCTKKEYRKMKIKEINL